jgi:hypothetical protein
MFNIKPVEVPGYLIPFIIHECKGVDILKADGNLYEISIEPRSVMGMFLSRTIRPSYKVKSFILAIYYKKIGENTAYSAEVMEYQNNAEFKVDLSFDDISNFYRFLENIFFTSIFFFIQGYCAASTDFKRLSKAINIILEKYDLLEYGYSESQLKVLYHRYNETGGINNIKNNKSFSVKKFLF